MSPPETRVIPPFHQTRRCTWIAVTPLSAKSIGHLVWSKFGGSRKLVITDLTSIASREHSCGTPETRFPTVRPITQRNPIESEKSIVLSCDLSQHAPVRQLCVRDIRLSIGGPRADPSALPRQTPGIATSVDSDAATVYVQESSFLGQKAFSVQSSRGWGRGNLHVADDANFGMATPANPDPLACGIHDIRHGARTPVYIWSTP